MRGSRFLIGTDIGTSGTKSVLVDLQGNVKASSLVEHGIITPRALWAEQWPDVWLAAVERTISDVVSSAGVTAAQVAGICISGLYGGSGVPCDSRLEVVRPCIIWMDRRASEESSLVTRQVGLDRLYAVTGNGADPYFGFTKILWIKRQEPENWRRISLFLPPNAYVMYRLTGEVAIDYSSAGNIGGIFDLGRRAWAEELMEEVGIPMSLMPDRLVGSSDIVGRLTREAAGRTGLLAGTPVCAGGVDCVVATLSAGVLETGQHVAVIGTSVNWGVVYEGFPKNRTLVTMPYVKEPLKKCYSYGGASTAGALPRWFRDNFAELEKEAERTGGQSPYAALDSMAAQIPPGSNGLLVLPYFMGERCPIWDVNARGTILGLTLHHGKAHVYRAILESVAYALRHIVEATGTGVELGRPFIVVGGATKSRLWMQIFADVLGSPIIRPRSNVEAPLGDALLAGVGVGVLNDFSVINEWVDLEDPVIPDPDRHATYSRYFDEYLHLYPTLSDTMRRLVGIAGVE